MYVSAVFMGWGSEDEFDSLELELWGWLGDSQMWVLQTKFQSSGWAGSIPNR